MIDIKELADHCHSKLNDSATQEYKDKLSQMPTSGFLNTLKTLLTCYDDHGFRQEYIDPNTGDLIKVDQYTMLTPELLSNIEYCIREVCKNNIPGDFIECGVWRGGACVYAKHVLNELGENRKVYLADSFAGLPAPNTESYPDDDGDPHWGHSELAIPVAEVKRVFNLFNALDENVYFIEGFFKDTLPTAKEDIGAISVLRLDADMYEGTIQALDNLYDKLSIGGYCIIDDWLGVPGCTQAVIDFREKHNIDDRMLYCQPMPSVTGMHPSSHFWQKTK